MNVRVSRLVSWRPKLLETVEDVREGRLSRTPGPIEVARLENGDYFVIDGHHRALQCTDEWIPVFESQYVKYYDPTLMRMMRDSMRITEAK